MRYSLAFLSLVASSVAMPAFGGFGGSFGGFRGGESESTTTTTAVASTETSTTTSNEAAVSSVASSSTSTTSTTAESSDSTESSSTTRTTAPSGALTVGSGYTYSTIQEAVDALDTSTSTTQTIFIGAGTYTEQVLIPDLSSKLIIYGYSTDTSSYSGNGATVTHALAQASGDYNDDETGTVRVQADYVSIYNLNIINSYGEGSQAIALSAYGDYFGCYGCSIEGYQDTLLAEQGYQVYAASYISGAIDYIFGQTGAVWIDSSTIESVAGGTITASGRASDNDSWYVLNKCTVLGSSSVSEGTVYLGRPWEAYARVVFQESSLSDVINSAGWEEWSSSEPNTSDVYLAEYDNSGDGASGTRASFATTLTSAVEITTVLGSGYTDWVDTSYLS